MHYDRAHYVLAPILLDLGSRLPATGDVIEVTIGGHVVRVQVVYF